ncbi:MAG: TIGR01777 family oxidoreductase [Fluviicoccus sp.]|uniref:TIGR01777 family oxidoreductase n=1 Tax=Fluviicoccus sp. TaxID=2003552 RepID=UPI0027239ECB|nr:TIGR01777 family oxidoreductase [Fluviicoccus sp.]MDO8330779.1 TIGR01777 family oxidoreductase [Fluviicoccus sp.]
MRILLTGGSGFLGSHLCPLLLKEGHHVTIVSRQPMKIFTRYDGMVRALRRLTDLTIDDHFDAVINLSGEGIADQPWTHPRKLALYTSRVNFTEELVDWMRRTPKPPKVLLSGSAIGWYGVQGAEILDEDSTGQEEFTHHLCHDWEKAALAAGKLGVRVCLLRTGVVLARKGGMLRRMLPVFGLNLGGRLGDGEQWMSWIGLQDWLSAVMFLLADERLQGPFNLTSPQPVSNAEFTEVMAHTLKRRAFLHVPGTMLRLLMGEMSVLMLGSQRVLPSRLLSAGFSFRTPELQKALETELGMSGT